MKKTLQNEYFLAKTGLDAAENGPSKVPTRRPNWLSVWRVVIRVTRGTEEITPNSKEGSAATAAVPWSSRTTCRWRFSWITWSASPCSRKALLSYGRRCGRSAAGNGLHCSLRNCIARCDNVFFFTKMYILLQTYIFGYKNACFRIFTNICQTLFSTLAGAAAQ